MALHHEGFPIRKSADISLICSSPQLIAACHVLLRLLMPRHSPYALVRLNFLQKISLLLFSFLELLEFLRTFSVCSKKAFAFPPFHFSSCVRGSLRFPLVEIVSFTLLS